MRLCIISVNKYWKRFQQPWAVGSYQQIVQWTRACTQKKQSNVQAEAEYIEFIIRERGDALFQWPAKNTNCALDNAAAWKRGIMQTRFHPLALATRVNNINTLLFAIVDAGQIPTAARCRSRFSHANHIRRRRKYLHISLRTLKTCQRSTHIYGVNQSPLTFFLSEVRARLIASSCAACVCHQHFANSFSRRCGEYPVSWSYITLCLYACGEHVGNWLF